MIDRGPFASTNTHGQEGADRGYQLYSGKIAKVELLGSSAPIKWTQTAAGLAIELPTQQPSDYALALRIKQ